MKASSNNVSNINATFGIFVGLYNKTNGTNWTVKSAAKDDGMVALFSKTMGVVNDPMIQFKRQADQSQSTKSLSLEEFRARHGNKVAIKVFEHIKANGGSYRAAIATDLGMRISTVCARVNELKGMGLIKCIGTTIDPSTNKKVEVVDAAV